MLAGLILFALMMLIIIGGGLALTSLKYQNYGIGVDRAQYHKNTAKIWWKISQCSPQSSYENPYSGDKVKFTDELIHKAKTLVEQEEQTNKDWSKWVAEWKAEEQRKFGTKE